MNWKLESNEFYVIVSKDEKVDRFLSDGSYKFHSSNSYCFVTSLHHAIHFSTADEAKTLIEELSSTITKKMIIVKVRINFEKI